MGTATILLVDDAPAVRTTTAEILRRTGYRVIEAGTPSDALAITVPIDLAVCDVVLPDMSGHELAARLRESRPDLPVVFISGYVPAEAEALAEDPFLGKPFSPDALLSAIRGALRTRR